MFVSVIEKNKEDGAAAYEIGSQPVSRLLLKWSRELFKIETQKLLDGEWFFEAESCISDMFERLQNLKGEP